MKLANLELVQEMVEQGFISVKKHPNDELYIYNYTRLAELKKVWNEATNACRGIICDGEYNVVARPFGKFFNYEELIEAGIAIPNLPFEITEKLDGSLGILYFIGNIPYIATRGAFTSEQAEHATNILHTKYKNVLSKLDKAKTYLFEIIYPENDSPLVVKYGETDDIFLLAVVNTATGTEEDIELYNHIFKTTTKYKNVTDYLAFRKSSNGVNREGFVIRFSNGFRLKLKFDEYFKAHSLVSHLSDKVILEHLMNGTIDELERNIKECLSEESYIYFKSLVSKFTGLYAEVLSVCKNALLPEVKDRKLLAKHYLSCKYPSVMFALHDGKYYEKAIWNIVRKLAE